MTLSLIAAIDQRRGLGKAGLIPWELPPDLQRFRDLTMGQVVVMGRKTWQSLPDKYRPLPGRTNIVLSRQQFEGPDLVTDANWLGRPHRRDDQIFVIGGGQIYRSALPLADRIFLTEVLADFKCDVTFPELSGDWQRVEVDRYLDHEGLRYRFVRYLRSPS
jgi:dihydrofolate reductase